MIHRMSFNLLVVGSGGGPSEHNLSAYLLKASNAKWTDGCVGLEAGSGLGALEKILQDDPSVLGEIVKNCDLKISTNIYARLETYLISHAHLDHIASLIMLAGSIKRERKTVIRGLRACLEDMDKNVFSGRIWPQLVTWNDRSNIKEYPYLFKEMKQDDDWEPLLNNLSAKVFPISHGCDYASSAFFIRNEENSSEFLFFGDVESDTIADKPLLDKVWDTAASKISSGALRTIFIECSWPEERPDKSLYGHLKPSHLVRELEVLAQKVCLHRQENGVSEAADELINGAHGHSTNFEHNPKSEAVTENGKKRSASTILDSTSKRLRATSEEDSLSGLCIFIVHCKEDIDNAYPGQQIWDVITDQVRTLAKEKGLGVTVRAAKQGQMLTF